MRLKLKAAIVGAIVASAAVAVAAARRANRVPTPAPPPLPRPREPEPRPREDGPARLEDATRAELYEEAKRRDIRGRSRMSKAELRAALEGDRPGG